MCVFFFEKKRFLLRRSALLSARGKANVQMVLKYNLQSPWHAYMGRSCFSFVFLHVDPICAHPLKRVLRVSSDKYRKKKCPAKLFLWLFFFFATRLVEFFVTSR